MGRLSVNERKLRNMYLRGLLTGEIQGPPTGYPCVDKPWLVYYDVEKCNYDIPKMNVFEYIKSMNNNKNNVAITYYGKEITYGDLFKNVDIASKSLTKLGVKNNDRIMFLMPNIPETAYLFYGAAQIGAVSDYVDPRPDSVDFNVSAKKILSLVESEKIKHLVVLDQCYLAMIKPIEKELKELGIEEVTLVSPTDSMGMKEKINYLSEGVSFDGIKFTKSKMKNSKVISKKIDEAISTSLLKVNMYSDLVKESKDVQFTVPDYIPGKLCSIVHTSGTSSPKPKAIPLTHENFNAYAEQTFSSNMPMKEGDKALHILPYFAAFGIVDVVHAGFSHSNNLVQIPEFSPNNLGKMLLRYKPQIVIGTPTWYLGLLEDKSLKDKDLSFISMMTYGGDSMEVSDEDKINSFLNNHGYKGKLTKGHGMSETCGCSSYATNDYNLPGTLGIPMSNTIYGIVNPDTKEPIRFTSDKDYVEGELIISSNSATSGVLDGNEIVKHVEYFGEDFIFTRDIARMYKNGVMQFLTRSDRSFTRFDGFKVKPYEIENVIKSNPKVKYCVISPYYEESRFGNMPIAHIVLNDEADLDDNEQVEIVRDIINNQFVSNPSVSTRQIPSKFLIRKDIPLTKNGKVNYNELVAEGLSGDEICVDLEETNISIGDIKIYKPNNTKKLKK
ncbi:MAG: AMP-binding protein [Bacilli bacterium]|nr:AMP-binding protein [Bacilli bacterium]